MTAQSTVVLGVISAVCGAGAAWETARLRRAAISTWAPARSELRIAAEYLGPTALLGLLGLLAALVVFAPSGVLDLPGGPSLAVLAAAYAVVLSHIALGYLAGRKLSRLLGPALMLIVGYFWGFWPAAVSSPPWLRHLNGQGLGECCRLDQVPSHRSLGATLAFSAGILAVALIVALMRPGRQRLVLAVAAALLGVTTAITAAAPLGFNGEQARDRALLRCVGSQPEVCLWPEQQARQDEFVRWAKEANRRLRAVGITPAARIEYSPAAPERDTILAATAASGLPLDPPACAEQSFADYPGDEAASVIAPWLALTAGVRPDSLAWPQKYVQLTEKVSELPAASQREWLKRNLRAVRQCSVKPELSPSVYDQGTKETR